MTKCVKITVAIPAFNAGRTICSTLESVLRQTVAPDEILVLDDGSTDDTASIVRSYEPRVSLHQQENRGVAFARNTLCAIAGGDLIAFLDSDDIWHPSYLEVQKKLFLENSDAVAFFSGHVNFNGYGVYEWPETSAAPLPKAEVEVSEPLTFLRRYHKAPGPFASMSYCCVPNRVLAEIGSEPFGLSGAEDLYFFTLLSLLGRPVVFASTPLVAYRITPGSLSANNLNWWALCVDVLRSLEPRYRKSADPKLLEAFELAFAARRRGYARLLMGAGEKAKARQQLRESLSNSPNPVSRSKSLALLTLTHMPLALQPRWRSSRGGPQASVNSVVGMRNDQ